MKITGSIMLILLLATGGCGVRETRLELPSLIGDNMLVQQKTNIKIWGKASPGRKISVSASWNESGNVTTDRDGKWELSIPTPEAGGPYTITIEGRDTSRTIRNVLVGEVWFCSGQSNMEMPLAGWPPADTVMYSASAIAAATIPEIRLFNVQRKVSITPLDGCTGTWDICSPSAVKAFSATAYFFGKKLHDQLNIPIGLIESAWGGTPAESWISSDALERAGEFTDELKSIRESAPALEKYQMWLDSHRTVTVNPAGTDQWKGLDFGDGNIPLPDYDDTSWPVISLPGQFESETGEFDGVVWFRKKIDIPGNMAGKDLVLSLGPIDDMDWTYFNGQLAGTHEEAGFWQAERNYNIAGEKVKAGQVTIAVRVLDNQGGGGIWGQPGSMKLFVKGNESIHLDLDGEWKFQPVAELSGDKFYVFDPSLNEFPVGKKPATPGPYSPSTLFNGMVKPVVNYRIKGAIWYQGEANVGRADQYSLIFPLMINNWRNSWNSGDFPFYFVQIAPYIYSNVDSTESAYLRESQGKALELPNTGMAVTLDIATVMNIHPPFKREVGERLANLALVNDYGEKLPLYGPVFKSSIVEGNSVRIEFDNVEGGLVSKGEKLTEFEIAGKDGKYVRADARIDHDEVLVYSPTVRNPLSVRYCWRNGSEASLFNGLGLPALQFRTK
jgi:sialate O-acetylesterase